MTGSIAHNSMLYAIQTPLEMINYQFIVTPKWEIEGHPLYFIDDKNKVRNINTGKELQMQLKGYTKGYILNGKFYSLGQIRPLLKKYKEEYQSPF
jgi:hypothetical protein